MFEPKNGLLSVADLSFSYRTEKLFSRLELSLSSGGICGLLGKNGAGKTTLLKLLAGLLFPQQGEILVAGERPADRSPSFLQDLFLVPEEFRLPPVSPLQYEHLFAPFYPGFDTKCFSALLEEFELDPRNNLTRCSFGQRKKCLLAFGLAANCRLILLDEPSNGLDIPSKSQFRSALASALTRDRLFVIATHQARDLEDLIDTVVILDDGQVIFNQSLHEIQHQQPTGILHVPTDPQRDFTGKTGEGDLDFQHNPGQNEFRLDLELLFNTVIKNRNEPAAVFQRSLAHEN